MGLITKTYTFVAGTLADATQVNTDFDQLFNLVNGNISGPNLAALCVTSAKIAAGAVGSAKIADDAVTIDKIADDAVDTGQIVDDAVTADKIDFTRVLLDVGSYTGNNASDRALTGVGFLPVVLIAYEHFHSTGDYVFVKTAEDGLYTKETAGGWWGDIIVSLDADGFTINGSGNQTAKINEDGRLYTYIALGVSS